VLQVLIDEAEVEFQVADAASGGVFNLALWCSGRNGTQIADAWRNTDPLDLVAVNPSPWTGLSSLERFRKKVLPQWDLDWSEIRRREKATFNVYDFTAHELRTLEAQRMNEDLLLACVSLPMWFPPASIDGHTYVDAVFATDANLEAAIANGANELWVVWTVSTAGEWRNGFVNQYFQMIENASVWAFKSACRRIERSNEAIANGGHGEFAHPVRLKILSHEVPLHYLLVFSADRLCDVVDYGVEWARGWCADNGVPLRKALPEARGVSWMRFTEKMAGSMRFAGGSGDGPALDLDLRLTASAGNVSRLLSDREHAMSLTGWVACDALGGRRLPIEGGVFNVLVWDEDPRHRTMQYRVFFRDAAGHPLTLIGEKLVPRDPVALLHVWRDVTTLFARLVRGYVEAGEEAEAELVATATVRITFPALLHELSTFRAHGKRRRAPLGGLLLVLRYWKFFVGSLRRVYLSR
jgi:hypothetical protein